MMWKFCNTNDVTLDWVYDGDMSGLPARLIEKPASKDAG
jgi:hypothetical protein